MSHTEADTARMIVEHHAHLARELDQRIDALIGLVDTGHLIKAEGARQDLLSFVRHEVLPHARAEEQALYPPAAAQPEGRLLVSGMVAENHALTALVAELADAASLVRAAATARALGALFAVHLHKENDLVLPLLVATPDVTLGTILAGMHELLGADPVAV